MDDILVCEQCGRVHPSGRRLIYNDELDMYVCKFRRVSESSEDSCETKAYRAREREYDAWRFGTRRK